MNHLEVWEAETFESDADRNWHTWIGEVERLMGHDADGDQSTDGYSMDVFYDLWQLGQSPSEAIHNIASVVA